MGKQSAFSINLSQEELFVILIHLKTNALPGLDGSVFDALTNEQKQLALGVAERGLIAREMLIADSDAHRFKLEPVTFATVGACAKPDLTLMLMKGKLGGPLLPYFFHLARKMVVVHSVPMTGIHHFIALEDKKAMLRALISTLDFGSPSKLDCPEGRMSEDTLTAARKAASEGGYQSALEILSQSGLEPSTAENLANSLAHPASTATLVRIIHHGNGKEDATGGTFLAGDRALWFLEPVENGSKTGTIAVSSTSTQEAVTYVKELLSM